MLFVVIPIYLVQLGAQAGDLNTAILNELNTSFATLWFLRLFLAFTGAGILSGFNWYLSAQGKYQRVLYLFVILAFVCVLAAELIARYLFYARNATLLIGGHL